MKPKMEPKVYTEAFKFHVLEEIASGKWKSALEASRAYRITGTNTVYSWMDKYGYGHLRNRRVTVSTPKEVNELKRLKAENKQLKEALSDVTVMNLLNEKFLEKACERLKITPGELKKKSGMNVPLL